MFYMNTQGQVPTAPSIWNQPFQHGGMPSSSLKPFANVAAGLQANLQSPNSGAAVVPQAPTWGGAPLPGPAPTAGGAPSIAPRFGQMAGAPPATGQIPGQPWAQYGVNRKPWWGYSLPQMGNQQTPFNEQQPINPVGDVLNPAGPGGGAQAQANAGLSEDDVLRMIYNAQQSQLGIDERSGPSGFGAFKQAYDPYGGADPLMRRVANRWATDRGVQI